MHTLIVELHWVCIEHESTYLWELKLRTKETHIPVIGNYVGYIKYDIYVYSKLTNLTTN